MKLIQSMRWYGPQDGVTLTDLRQAGCTGVVTALHHIPVGDVWPVEDIIKRKREIEKHGMVWSAVESLPVHEDIKSRTGDFQAYIKNYKISLKNLAKCDVKVVTYNFMPVLDWMRTDLEYKTKTGALALRFNRKAFTAFDLYILQRPGAKDDFTSEEQAAAKAYLNRLTKEEYDKLQFSCLQALPGDKNHFTPEKVLTLLDGFKGVTKDVLKENLVKFLSEIIPLAEENRIQMAIHPDDPPYPILGLPRIVSTEEDARFIIESVPSKANGLCFCTGSYGVRPDNDLPGMIQRLGHRIHFFHLRNTQRDTEGNFFEADHLEGNADMYRVMKEAVLLMRKENRAIPMRPDHGHQMLDDLANGKLAFPGYTAIGRLRGLAELRGLELGISKSFS